MESSSPIAHFTDEICTHHLHTPGSLITKGPDDQFLTVQEVSKSKAFLAGQTWGGVGSAGSAVTL